MTDQSRLTWALIASILLHGLLLALLPWMRQLRAELPRPPALLDVDVLPMSKPAPPPPAVVAKAEPQVPAEPPPPAIRLPDRQIVSPSDAGEEKAPDNTRLLSDRDNTVKQESVKRAPIPSEPKASEAAAKPQPAAEAAAPTKREESKRVARAEAEERHAHTQVAALPKLDQLLPPVGDLLGDVGGQPERAAPAAPSQSADARRQLFTGNREVFSSRPGINDFLPSIRDSDITLLNTKAERFAPFVRRVAGRVFQHLDIRLRQSVGHAQLQSGREYAVVEAVMNRQGQLVGAHVIERQSTTSLSADRVLLSVTEPDTFFDANPPAGAEANDGNIHFILLIDLMVEAAADQHGRRATGYHGIAGVGLDSAPEQRGAHAD